MQVVAPLAVAEEEVRALGAVTGAAALPRGSEP